MDRRLLLRWLVAGLVATVPVGLVVAGGHRGAHAARSLLVPGAGLVEAQPALAALCLLAAAAATVGWLRWGTDWILVAVVGCSMAASAAWGTGPHDGTGVATSQAAHEFPFVILVAGAIGWARAGLGRIPGFGWVRGRRVRHDTSTALVDLAPVDRCRAAAVLGLAGPVDDDVRAALRSPDVERRARRIGLVARARRGDDAFAVDHAHARAALVVATHDEDAVAALRTDAEASRAGVPASEPTWVRPFDATLAAAALHAVGSPDAGTRWAGMLDGPLQERRGHRPAWWWTPLGIAAGRSLDWEHAATTAIAHAHGWIDDADWPVLRQRVLGAAARGAARRDDERLIAAGRVWLAQVEDPEASRILSRPTVRHDPLARALDTYATALAHRRAPAPNLVGGTR